MNGEGVSEKRWVDLPRTFRVNLTRFLKWDLTGWVIPLSRLRQIYRFHLLDFISSAAIPSAAWNKVR